MSQSNVGDRRSFILTSGAVLAGATVCSGCSIFTSQAKPDIQRPATDGAFTLSAEEAGRLTAPGDTLRVTTPDGSMRIFLVRGQDGKLLALSMACTHWGSDVNYEAAKNQLVCPSHGSRFGLDGSVLEGPAGDPLDRYKVEEGFDGDGTPTGIRIILT